MINSAYIKLIDAVNRIKPEFLLVNMEGALTGFDFIQETVEKQIFSEKPGKLENIVRSGDINLPNHPRAVEIKLNNISVDGFDNAINELLQNQIQLFMLAISGFKFLDKAPPVIESLKNLRILQIAYTGLEFIPAFVDKLPFLEILTFHDNKLQSLPIELKELMNLTEISVAKNKITTLPTEIGNIPLLNTLNISGNNFATLPYELFDLKNLKHLDISFNQLSVLPKQIENLKNLTELDARNNKLMMLPSEIQNLTSLQTLRLRNNPLPIPPEILEKADEPQKILNYYFSLSNKWEAKRGFEQRVQIDRLFGFAKPINEIKLLVVGQGSVGKTSLVQQILHGTFDQNQTKTEGISINQWEINGDKEIRGNIGDTSEKFSMPLFPVRLNTWDFGGQEIMHATHQFFLTKRSLYLLVVNARQTQEENRIEYWLKIIQSFGGDSPVLIVGNQTDEHPFDIDKTGLQKKYQNIVGILETSAKTGAGIETLKAEIAKQVDTLPHVRDLLPETWFTVKSKLEELGRDKNFITQDEYLNMCATNKVTDETSQHTLIGFLHDLGVVLHFQDDPRLEALGILNPQWVTNGVYKILNSHELFQNQGQLTLPLLNNILNLPEYPSNKRLFIVDMMKKFELCYDIEPDKSFLIPDLLSRGEPFTGDWDNALAFQYHYNVLPSSIITRFIVRMNMLIYKNTIWRSGVVLKQGVNTARVIADYEDRTIDILVSGKNETRRDLLAMIRGEFEAIHKTIAKIEVTEKIPLPNAPEADPIDLTFLQQAASEGRESLPVKVGNHIIDLIVKEVLSQIEKDGKSSPSTNIYNISGNVYGAVGSNNTVNFIQQKFEPVYEAIEASSRDFTEKQDLAAEVDEIKDEVAKGDQANESFLARRLRNLKKMAPDIAEVALSALAGPGAAISSIVKNVAKKIKEEQ